jgi:hypothetical protein
MSQRGAQCTRARPARTSPGPIECSTQQDHEAKCHVYDDKVPHTEVARQTKSHIMGHSKSFFMLNEKMVGTCAIFISHKSEKNADDLLTTAAAFLMSMALLADDT